MTLLQDTRSRFGIRNRFKKAFLVQRFMWSHAVNGVLLVGVGGVRENVPYEGIVERAIADSAGLVIACDLAPRDGSWPFVVADGRTLPFRDSAFDLVVSNAVIEHVGSEADQRRFVCEHERVGLSWVITTPNRWFPVESHTGSFFLHWLPRLRDGRVEFTRLLSRREFRALLPAGARLKGGQWSATFMATKTPRQRNNSVASAPREG